MLYNAAMWRAGLHRRLVALVAAYAVALQGLLAAVATVSPAPVLDAVVCAAQASAHPGFPGKSAPLHGSDCTLCPLACGSAVTPPPPAPSIVLAVAPAEPASSPRPQVPVAPAVLRAGLARAPPG